MYFIGGQRILFYSDKVKVIDGAPTAGEPLTTYRSVFVRPGIEMEHLGRVEKIDGQPCRALAIPVTAQQLANVRQKTGITNNVLRFTHDEGERQNAKAA